MSAVLKYRNKPTEVDGVWFASKREARRWGELKLMERVGYISDLRRQVRFPLRVNDELVTTYVADAAYQEKGRLVVEDAKGCRTKEYAIKAKLFAAIHGFAIKEV